MTKITIERETLELAASLIQPLTGKGDREVYDALRAALAQKAEPPSMPQGKSLALLDLDSVEHMQGGANGPTIRLRGFINAQTGPTAPQPPIDNAFVADGCEQFSPPAEPAPVPCCGKYETCSHACTPRGKWLGRREAERAALAAQPAEPVAIVDESDDGKWADILPNVNVRVGDKLYAAQPAPAAVPPAELTWLFTHCRAIGMVEGSESGKWEHDIALFTQRQAERIRVLSEALTNLEAMAERYRPPGYPIPDAQKAARAALEAIR